ncbi:MAG: 16S rRNA (adenine(1518)-N(6)/adenine(1519)-N(6))-dimethyltransferase RsmA [Patescibacteria group bacterium]
MRAKKSLGQNFLTSRTVAAHFLDAAHIEPGDTVVEVGPGMGFLTEFFLKNAQRVIAVEKDARMIEYLREKFSKEIISKKLILIHDDILNFGPETHNLKPKTYKLIGSIPYYLTGALLKKFLSADIQPQSMTLIVQREVAERIVARDKKESILSISVKAYGTPHYIETIDRQWFSPEPNVDSALLHIDEISKKNFSEFTDSDFFALVKEGFKSKRKKISGNLRESMSKEDLVAAGVSPDARAEDLALEQWKKLCAFLSGRADATIRIIGLNREN